MVINKCFLQIYMIQYEENQTLFEESQVLADLQN